ncbi:filamentation induced by cAMP protein Fic [Anaeromyxobacter sp. K]|uniref:Fic family protein n=1 Tax=Anaeromyxobacter sp. (strain K) TaxID=447217 RepID=UPI00015F99F3|nr:Fic family protein [Anaeromyxobacter sp. K]ACG72340.1 filamentation induced by cAMP protein Fic [Anaeromyxobacter sp. K]
MRTRYVDIDDRMEDLADRLRGDPEIVQDFLARYELSWLYHENALEGVVYSSQELATALANAPLADVTFVSALQEIRNHKVALDLVREEAAAKKPKLNLTTVKKLYETLGHGIEGRSVAEYRKDMPLHRAYFHDIAQPAKIQPALQKLLETTEGADFRNAHPIQQACKLHHGFMQVFPFTENSGRVARLLANLVLLHAGYKLPVIVHATDRQRYYESLRLPETILRDLTMEALDNGLSQAEKYFAEAPRARKAAR